MAQKFVSVFRGDRRESCHYGSLAVVDKDINLIASAGEPKTLTFWRSAAKPVQLLPVLTSGAAEHFGFTDEELAVMMASHSGEKCHRNQVKSILEKIGADKEDLTCGTHSPINKEARKNLYRNQAQPDVLHNNCSGKHAAMLSLCAYHDWSWKNYQQLEHPLQQLLLDYISRMSGYPRSKINTGIDGCGVIVYYIPLKNMAAAYARMINPVDLSEDLAAACSRLVSVMSKHPRLVAGSKRFNTELLAGYSQKEIMAKTGAEGIFCFAHRSGWGAALKIYDGNKRAIPPLVLESLAKLAKLNPASREGLEKYIRPVIKNHRDDEVGHIQSELNLKIMR